MNLLGPVILTHAFLPDLIDRPDAHLVNIASLAGVRRRSPGASTYGSSKWGVIGFSESIELELAEQGNTHVHVTTVCPGVVSTGLFDGARPLRLTRILTPDDVAEAVVTGVLHNRSYVRTPWLVKVGTRAARRPPAPGIQRRPRVLRRATMASWTGREGHPTGPRPGRSGAQPP